MVPIIVIIATITGLKPMFIKHQVPKNAPSIMEGPKDKFTLRIIPNIIVKHSAKRL